MDKKTGNWIEAFVVIIFFIGLFGFGHFEYAGELLFIGGIGIIVTGILVEKVLEKDEINTRKRTTQESPPRQ